VGLTLGSGSSDPDPLEPDPLESLPLWPEVSSAVVSPELGAVVTVSSDPLPDPLVESLDSVVVVEELSSDPLPLVGALPESPEPDESSLPE
jgi:hypothetical protein